MSAAKLTSRGFRKLQSLLLCLVYASIFSISAAQAEDLIVSAAVSLKEPFIQLASTFERKHPGAKVIFNFGASGTMATQISQGAPVDVFASASLDQMERLNKLGLIGPAPAKCFARNTLVVIVPTAGKKYSSLEALGETKKLALGDPQTVPAGRYAVEVLKGAHLYNKLSATHALIFGESVRQVVTYVESGEVDAGIVYNSEAKTSKHSLISLKIPHEASEPVLYPIATIKNSKEAVLAQSFVDFISNREQWPVFKSFGFLAPDHD